MKQLGSDDIATAGPQQSWALLQQPFPQQVVPKPQPKVVHAGTMHLPPLHRAPVVAVHLCPQAPQLFGSFMVLTHPLPQQVRPT